MTLSHSFVLTRSLSVTETVSASILSVSETVSISAFDSTFTFIPTKFIYYDYKVVQYSSYYDFYSDFFTIIHQNESPANDNNATIITAVCVAIAAIIIISLLVVLLIKIRGRKLLSEEQESDNFEGNDTESMNSFSTALTISNVEEDPFANDFKEDQIITSKRHFLSFAQKVSKEALK